MVCLCILQGRVYCSVMSPTHRYKYPINLIDIYRGESNKLMAQLAAIVLSYALSHLF